MTRSQSGQQRFFVSVCYCLGHLLVFVQRLVRFCSVCNSHMVVRALGLTLSSGIFGQYMCCRPMCSQCVHRSVSVALWIELQFSGSRRSLPIPPFLFSILFYLFIYLFTYLFIYFFFNNTMQVLWSTALNYSPDNATKSCMYM